MPMPTTESHTANNVSVTVDILPVRDNEILPLTKAFPLTPAQSKGLRQSRRP
jgi:hypothetical protein